VREVASLRDPCCRGKFDATSQIVYLCPKRTTFEGAELDPEEWIDEHGDYLFRYALVLKGGDCSAIEEMVQETFVAALSVRGCQPSSPLRPEGWVCTGGLTRAP